MAEKGGKTTVVGGMNIVIELAAADLYHSRYAAEQRKPPTTLCMYGAGLPILKHLVT